MRIACLHIPGFSLQVRARRAPHLRGEAFAVVESGDRAPRVRASSRAAQAHGVRPGMPGRAARSVAPGVRLVELDRSAEGEAMAALGEAVLSLSPTVDVRSPGQIYCAVPHGERAESFGQRLLDLARRHGFTGRVGIAGERFTAWAATQATPHEPVRVVPRGQSQELLAPLSLDLLPVPETVRETLRLLGVRTLGDFGRLPPPTLVHRHAAYDHDLHAAARGRDPRPLLPFSPGGAVREVCELERPVDSIEELCFLVRPLLERLVERARGRKTAIARLRAVLDGDDGARTELDASPTEPTRSHRALEDALKARLSEGGLAHPVRRVELQVLDEGTPRKRVPDLFDRISAGDPVRQSVSRTLVALSSPRREPFNASND